LTNENKDNSQERLTFQVALKHYSNKVIALTEDENVRKGNEIIKNDILEHLTNILTIITKLLSLENMSLQEFLREEPIIITTYKNIISASLFLYREDLNESKRYVADKLNEGLSDKLSEHDLTFSNIKSEIKRIEKALEYVERRSKYNL
jgi:hypothetical protein